MSAAVHDGRCHSRPGALLVALLGLCLVASGCTTTSQVSTQYYDVSGSTSTALDREIRRNGPNNGKAIAMAGIRIGPVDLQPSVSAGLCRFRRAKFGVSAAITLPRWREAAFSRDADLRRSWKGFAAYARAHEEVHVKIAEEFARVLERSFLAIAPQPSCGRLEAVALALHRKAVPLYTKAQLAFDAQEQKRLARLVRLAAQAERAKR